MGFLGLGILLLLVGILLIALVTRITARNLKLTALAFIFILAVTAVIIFVIAGRYGLAAPTGALALWGMRAYLLPRRRRRSQVKRPCRALKRWIFWGLQKAHVQAKLKRLIKR